MIVLDVHKELSFAPVVLGRVGRVSDDEFNESRGGPSVECVELRESPHRVDPFDLVKEITPFKSLAYQALGFGRPFFESSNQAQLLDAVILVHEAQAQIGFGVAYRKAAQNEHAAVKAVVPDVNLELAFGAEFDSILAGAQPTEPGLRRRCLGRVNDARFVVR